ncbi:neutral/alkaline nonlysosomal ceramidase-like protein [Calycina marina]|uniref:Neutral ceramidase n=1 Tax=Calycina marina TaxID=1763456 RepID=A0A9P7YZG1_9HELO|nr:neutral/alkaline nonlysosomal ceramidase-like protein [Calycina marina]
MAEYTLLKAGPSENERRTDVLLDEDLKREDTRLPKTDRRKRIATRLATLALLCIAFLVSQFCLENQGILNFSYWSDGVQDLENHGSSQENSTQTGSKYLLGVGKADITGPVVEINMMGYADTKQLGSGLRQRLYSRAFIVGDIHNPKDRFIYLVLDTQSGDTAVRYAVLEDLAKLGPHYAAYGQQNVAVTGTHSHSGPGAWLNYLLPQITSKGFDKQSYRAIVDGVVLSIKRAHESLQPGYLTAGTTKVTGANINRSLYAYLANPGEERAQYNASSEDDGSVEKHMTLLRFQRASDGKSTGILTWFPVHGTSMLGNNSLISGDNKGVAATLFEKSATGASNVAEGFVAGFSQASVGDTSPNVLGAWCEDGSGQQCSFRNSTCSDGKSQHCHARGPFFRIKDSGASSCYEIGKRQFEPARDLFDNLDKEGIPISGSSVKAFHTFQSMSNFTFPLKNGTYVQTCPAALGYSFAAGTSDGPGAFDFTQNDPGAPSASPVWHMVSGLIKTPSKAQQRCHHLKPILLDVGEIEIPYLWTPNIVDIQAFRVGQLVIIVSPGEATTMAGRRWKGAVYEGAKTLLSSSSPSSSENVKSVEPIVVLGGPANSYAHYISTTEEYSIQRYEGASTLYGPHTLDAYINLTLSHLPFLSPSSTSSPPPGPLPPNNVNRSLSFITGVVYDGKSFFKAYGDVLVDVHPSYALGATVRATFVGANPRNNLRLEQTFAAVERYEEAKGVWEQIRNDSDWSLIYKWRKTSEVLGRSEVEIVWETGMERGIGEGRYRLRYWGDAKSVGGKITAFEGSSAVFVLF